jgi:hypothetical protein
MTPYQPQPPEFSGHRSRQRLVMAIAIVAALVVGAALGAGVVLLRGAPGLVARASGTPIPTMSGAGDASPTAVEPTASGAASQVPAPTALAPDTFAQVDVNELNLREEPALAAASVGQLFSGARVFVVEGPRANEGYSWYRVVVAQGPYTPRVCEGYGCNQRRDVGWVAGVSQDQDAWLTALDLGCPSEPTLQQLTALTDMEQLACYGDTQLVLEGTVDTPCCGYVGAYRFEPGWLAVPTPRVFFHDHYLGLRFNPATGLPLPERGDVVRVTGHFDDPAAASCTVEIDQEAVGYDENGNPVEVEPPDTEGVPFGCRMQYVVDAIEVIGTEDLGPCCG